jgi:hypothetical protein
VKRLTIPQKIGLVAVAALAIVMAVNTPSQAAGGRGENFGGGRGGGEHHGFEGHHFEGHHFEGRHFEGRHFEGRHFEGRHFEGRDFDDRFGFGFGFGFGPAIPYDEPYYAAPSYWYYCPSYRAYYPNVTTCPEPWVSVPAS